MEYKKYNEQAYNLHFIKTDKFKKIKIKINFKEEIEKEKIVYRNMLSLILLEATKKYNTRRLLDIECENLYSIVVGASTNTSGKYQILQFTTTFLNEKYTEKGMNLKSLKFFLDFIFEPYIVDNKFEKQTFENAKNILKDDIESYNDNPSRYAFSRLFEIMSPDSVIKYKNTGYIEDLMEVTPEKLYEYYKNLLRTNLIDIFVIGNIDFSDTEKIIKENFDINTLKKSSDTHIVEHKTYRKKEQIIKEKKMISQSILLMAYKLKDITSFERQYVLALYNSILGGSPDSKLFKEVREKNSLCYSIYSSYSGITNTQYVVAGIDKENFDKSVKLIKKEIKRMADGDFTDEEVLQAKTIYLASLKEVDDTELTIINIYEAKEYLDYDILCDREKEIKKVTKEDIINISKKIYIDTIYLLEGDKDDEERD